MSRLRLAAVMRLLPVARATGDSARRRRVSVRPRGAGRRRWAGGVVLAALVAWADPALARDIVVVANPALPVETLSTDDLRAIYLGERTYVARMKVFPVAYATSDLVTEGFLRAVVGKTPSQFEAYWVKEIFHSGRLPPRKALSVADVLRIVATDPGAVGYVPAEALQGLDSVKRLFSLTVP